MDLETQPQPSLPLGGFPEQPAGHIQLKTPLYITALSALYVGLPQHYLALTLKSYPVNPKESRDRLVSSYSNISWVDLAAFLNLVWEAKGSKFRGSPTIDDWHQELELLHQAHIRAYRGY